MTLKDKIAEIVSWYSKFEDTKSDNSLPLTDKILSLISKSLPRVEQGCDIYDPTQTTSTNFIRGGRQGQKEYRDKIKKLFK